MSTLFTLSFCSIPVRIYVSNDNKVYFCAKDIYDVFGSTNSRKGIKDHLSERTSSVIKLAVEDSSGKKQKFNFVDELGTVTLITKSKLDIATELKQWLDSSVQDKVTEIKKNTRKKNNDAVIRFINRLCGSKYEFNNKFGIKDSNSNYSLDPALRDKLKAIYGKSNPTRQITDMYTPTELGKLIGTSARFTNTLLTKLGYQIKVGNRHKLTLLGQSKGGSYAVTSIKKGSSTPVGIIKWPKSVVEDLKKCMFEAE